MKLFNPSPAPLLQRFFFIAALFTTALTGIGKLTGLAACRQPRGRFSDHNAKKDTRPILIVFLL